MEKKEEKQDEKKPSTVFAIETIDVVLRGKPGSPLVVHNFNEKAKQEIRDKQGKKPKGAKEARNPAEEFDAGNANESMAG